jgi:adenine deaminase
MTDPAILARRIDQAMGREPADLVIRDARLLDVATGIIHPAADIAVCGDVIVGTLGQWRGRHEIGAQGRIAAPGLIDTHVHIESSMVTPAEFEKGVLPRGTTTAICDPHEIANVTGTAGIRYFLEAATRLAMTVRVNLSSCVPATGLETAGARLEAEDLLPLLAHPAALGLAEVMNYPGVVAKDAGMLRKLSTFARAHKDGHAPLLRGSALCAYLSTGITTDHECTTADEAREKLAKGMAVLIREGSVAKNVAALAEVLTEATWPRCAFCTDDRNPLEIVEDGHIDFALRKAIRHGAPVIPAWRSATLGAAGIFGLTDRGMVAPGRRADILLVDDLAEVAIHAVLCGGRLVEPALFEGREHPEPVGFGSVKRAPVEPSVFRMPASGPSVPVIGVIPHSIITERRTAVLPWRDGCLEADPARGLHKLAVLERHGVNGNVGRGIVEGFGPMHGAIAASIGHDCHNLIVVGDSDRDMALAINRLIELQGGIAVASEGQVLADLPLPVAGLMNPEGFDSVRRQLLPLRDATRAIGCALDDPVLQLAFLPLPVIPHLKLTDRGLVATTGAGIELLDAA